MATHTVDNDSSHIFAWRSGEYREREREQISK